MHVGEMEGTFLCCAYRRVLTGFIFLTLDSSTLRPQRGVHKRMQSGLFGWGRPRAISVSYADPEAPQRDGWMKAHAGQVFLLFILEQPSPPPPPPPPPLPHHLHLLLSPYLSSKRRTEGRRE